MSRVQQNGQEDICTSAEAFRIHFGRLPVSALCPPHRRTDSCLEIVVAAPSAIKAEPVGQGED